MTAGQLRAVVTANRLRLVPRLAMISSSTRVTRRLAKPVSTSSARHSRVKASTTLSTRIVRPAASHIMRKVQGPFLVGRRRRAAAIRHVHSVFASSASSTDPPRDIPGTPACGSLARPHVPPAPATSDSRSAASPCANRTSFSRSDSSIAATDTDSCSPQSTSARTPGAHWLRTAPATSPHPSSGLRAQAVFCDHRLQHLPVQAQIRHQLLQTVSSRLPTAAVAAPR